MDMNDDSTRGDPSTSLDASAGPAPAAAASRRPAWRKFRFPVLVVAAAVGLVALDYASDATLDYKNTFAGLLGVVAFLLVTGWVALFAPLRRGRRWAAVAAALLVVAGPLCVVKPEFDGDMRVVRWINRWTAPVDAKLTLPGGGRTADLATTTELDFPQFLGQGRRPIVEGVVLDTDWAARPPQRLWRRPIGAGLSGFAVVNGFAVTQQQQGDSELVVCYELITGQVIWSHADQTRFNSVMGGDGPRATPTIDQGRVYALGATGILNCLDGTSGDVLWQRNILEDSGAANLNWGLAGSPLVVDDLVIVSPGGPAGHSLAAYDKVTGQPRWSAGDDVASYASPAVATLGGVRQVLSVNQDWLVGHRLSDGQVLWRHDWPGRSDSNASASQALAVEGADQVFVSKGYDTGCTLLSIEVDDAGSWTATPVWDEPVKNVMKTKISNVAIRDGLVFGLDGGILQCVELATGESLWKGGRYGHGQILLVGDVLLVTTETGQIALVAARPDGFRELAKAPAIEGRTWNNPALYGPYLLIRNHLEAACYELPLAKAK